MQKQRILRMERHKSQAKELEQAKEIEKAYTELKVTQEQLIQAEKMASLGELTAGIAHEIKNPLNFINNFSEINLELLAEIDEDSSSKDAAAVPIELQILKYIKKNSEKINHHGKRVDSIVKGMLQHSRLGNLNKELIDINALCEETIKLAYHGYRAKEKTFNAAFETRFDPDLPKVNAVPQDLGRVILNIINNGLYAVHYKKRMTASDNRPDQLASDAWYIPILVLTTRKMDHKIVITISDNGHGIPSQNLAKIFQPFFTTKPTGEGTGLGLSMAYDIITNGHGGELKVKSREGEGTDFEITIPID